MDFNLERTQAGIATRTQFGGQKIDRGSSLCRTLMPTSKRWGEQLTSGASADRSSANQRIHQSDIQDTAIKAE